MRRGFGYKHKPPTLIQKAASAMRSVRVASDFKPTLHPPFEHLFRMFSALDQRRTNACTGYGLMRMLQLARALDEATPGLLSPVLPYWAARRRETGSDARVEDVGAYVHDIEWAFNAFGSCREEDWPFVELSDQEQQNRVNARPYTGAFQSALVQRSRYKLRLNPIIDYGARRSQRLAHSLHLNQACGIAIPVDDRFMYGRPGDVQHCDGIIIGNHFGAVLDWRVSVNGYEFLFGNSYSPGWGEHGTAWLSSSLVDRAHYVGFLGGVEA